MKLRPGCRPACDTVLWSFPMGATELIVIGLIVVLLFGASKLPELGRAVGEGVSNLKRGLREANDDPPKPGSPNDRTT